MMRQLNQYALDYYLRDNGGVEAQREAQQELYRRGQQSMVQSEMSEKDMVDHLRRLGYVVFKPKEK